MRTSFITYVLMAMLSFCVVGLLALALWPIVDLIVDGFKLISALLAGDTATIGSLVGK